LKEKINILLESKYVDIDTKLYYVKDIFKLMQFNNLEESNHNWLNQNQDKYEIINIYFEYVNTLKRSLNDFKNINHINDVFELKELLKEWFNSDDTDEKLKLSILYVISNLIEPSDLIFFKEVISKFFTYQDFSVANSLQKESIESLEYLKKRASSSGTKKQFWIDTSMGADENAIIMYNESVFFLWSSKKTNNNFQFSSYVKLINYKIMDYYFYNNPLFSLFNGTDIGCEIKYNILKSDKGRLKIKLLVLVGEEVYINEEVDVILFTKVISKLIKSTQVNQMQYYKNNKIPKDSKFIVEDYATNKPLIMFNLIFVKRNKDIAIIIETSNGIKVSKKLDATEVTSMLEELNYHLLVVMLSCPQPPTHKK